MVWDWSNSTSFDNSTFGNATFGNTTIPPPNSTLWQIPPNAGRSLQPDIIACAAITFLTATGFVGARFYTRGWLNHVLGPADWCILPALLCAAGVTASSLEQVAHGAGRHAWEVDVYALPAFERAAWYGILFYNLSLTLTRISILLLYKRIFTYSWIKRAIQIVLILIVAIGIWLVVSVCTACMPLQAFWDWSLYFTTFVYCQPPNLWWANAALHIASDLVIMALPMPVLSSLNLPRRQKFAIVGVFALGFGVCIISAVRLVTVIKVAGLQAYDATYTSAYMIYWTDVEVNAAICCACIMTLKPLIQRLFPRLLSPSKGIREPTLQWITPINNDSVHARDEPASPTSPTACMNQRRESAGSNNTSSTNNNKNSRSGSLPHVHEYEMSPYHQQDPHRDTIEKSRYYHLFTRHPSPGSDNTGDEPYDLDRDLDLEAQRTCSTVNTTTVISGRCGGTPSSSGSGDYYDDEDDYKPLDTGAGEAGSLRAPPRAHLRLATQVMPVERAGISSTSSSPWSTRKGSPAAGKGEEGRGSPIKGEKGETDEVGRKTGGDSS